MFCIDQQIGLIGTNFNVMNNKLDFKLLNSYFQSIYCNFIVLYFPPEAIQFDGLNYTKLVVQFDEVYLTVHFFFFDIL